MQNQEHFILAALSKLVPYIFGIVIGLLGYVWTTKIKQLSQDFNDLKKLIEQEKENRKDDFKQHEKYYELFFENIKSDLVEEKQNRKKEMEKNEKIFSDLYKLCNELCIKIEKIK